MEQITIDTRTMTPRVIAQELMDACGAYRGMRYPEVAGYCDDHYEVVDFDGAVMSAARSSSVPDSGTRRIVKLS